MWGSYFSWIQQLLYLFLSLSVILLQAAEFGFHLLFVGLLFLETLQKRKHQRVTTQQQSHERNVHVETPEGVQSRRTFNQRGGNNSLLRRNKS